MKTIGMIGGTSWHSTVEYYRIINEIVNKKLGGHHSAKIIISSLEFEQLVNLANDEDWQGIGEILTGEAKRLEQAGADFFLFCSNALHMKADQAADAVNIPLLHIADATSEKIKAENIERVGLLGARFTMEHDFYQVKLADHGIQALVPDAKSRKIIDNIIFSELVKGTIRDESRYEYLKIIDDLVENGAQGIILGCTEIPLLIKQEDVSIPLFDTTHLHAEAAVKMALSN